MHVSVDLHGRLGAGLGDAGGVGNDAAVGAAGLGLDAVGPEDGGVGVLVLVERVLQPQAVLLVGGGVACEDDGDPAAGDSLYFCQSKDVFTLRLPLALMMNMRLYRFTSTGPTSGVMSLTMAMDWLASWL